MVSQGVSLSLGQVGYVLLSCTPCPQMGVGIDLHG